MTVPDQLSGRVLQLLAAPPRGIDGKKPRSTPKAQNRALRTLGEEDVCDPLPIVFLALALLAASVHLRIF